MVKVISGVSRLLLVGVVIALMLAGCGGDWRARPGQTTTVTGPKHGTTTPASSTATSYSDHMGLPPEMGGNCPTGFPVKGTLIKVGVQPEQVYLTPDSANYASTKAEKCFKSADDAQTSQYVPLP